MGTNDTPTRRRYLKAASTIGIAAGIAGCSGNGNGNGDPGTDDEDTVTDPDGEKVEELTYAAASPSQLPAYGWAEIHANALEQIGLEIDFQALPTDDLVERAWSTRNFDISQMRHLDSLDPDRPAREYFASDGNFSGGNNFSGWEHPEFEELLGEQIVEFDEERRQEIVYEMQEIAMEEQPVSPVLVQDWVMAINTNLWTNFTSVPEEVMDHPWNWASMEPVDGHDEPLITSQAAVLDGNLAFNPLAPKGSRSARGQSRRMYDRLLHIGPDGEITPWLAQEMPEVDQENNEIHVRIRDGHTWHDGEPVTAEDVAFTFEWAPQHSASYDVVARPIQNVVAETDIDVTFEMEEMTVPFLSQLAGAHGSIIPEHIWENEPWDDDGYEEAVGWPNTENPIASGQFQMVDFAASEETRYEAHSDHFHAPNFDEIIRIEAADLRASMTQFEDERVHMLSYGLPTDDIQRVEEMEYGEAVDDLMLSIHITMYNLREEPRATEGAHRFLWSTEVRQALSHCVPQQEIIDVVFGGRAEPINSFYSPALDYWVNPDVPSFEYDIDRARSILSDLGFQWDEDGLLHYPPDWDPEEPHAARGDH